MKTTQKPVVPEFDKELRAAAAKAQSADKVAKAAKETARLAKAKHKAAKEAFKKAKKEAKKARKEHKALLLNRASKTICANRKKAPAMTPAKKATAQERHPIRAAAGKTASTPVAAPAAVAQPEAATQAPSASPAGA